MPYPGTRFSRGRHPSARRRRPVYRPEYRRLIQFILQKLREGYSYTDILELLSSGERPSPPSSPEPPPSPPPPVEDGKDDLKVEKVDFMVAENTQQHHTDAYDITEGSNGHLVVRRGQPFKISLEFSRPYRKTDDLRLVFGIGECPSTSAGTQIDIVLSDQDKEGHWGAKEVKLAGKSMTVEVFTPCQAIVGKWNFSVKVVKSKNDKVVVSTYEHLNPVYMLFNPWCKDDQVYMEGELEREAYVLKETGILFVGSKWGKKEWNYGQFFENVLDCCMYLLTEAGNVSTHGNVIKVARSLSAMVNVNDENGVLVGNWSGNYRGGSSPLKWAGSVNILEKFYEEKEPVRYGQCWVFSGVLTTVCRALGIPCRSVTNFASAHDTDGSTTIDCHFDENMVPLKNLDSDSIWNFHVWNEAWMTRPDLPDGYGGWQVIDATPQESSEGVMRCGPCPVRSVKEGEVTIPFDCPFIFAEVNGDEIPWIKMADGTMKVNEDGVNKSKVGKDISTLALDGVSREDVTDKYKYPDGSPEERIAVLRARQVTPTPPKYDTYKTGPKDVEFKVTFRSDTPVGQDFEMTLTCTSKSNSVRTVKGHNIINAMYYTGIPADRIVKKDFKDLTIEPRKCRTVTAKVTQADYRNLLRDGCHLRMTTGVRVKETNQIFTDVNTTMLCKPKLAIKASDKAMVNREFEVTVSFTNPLSVTLTECVLELEGPKIKGDEYKQSEVPANGTFFTTLKLKGRKKGETQIIFDFSSKELADISGEHKMKFVA